jgi:L-aminopeptidase/D-esterase-like protein
VTVGHATDPDLATGVTACLFDRVSPTVIDVRGGASCTYDTASLDLDATFGRRWGIFFAGGSIYGLDAARGVRTRLLERGLGQPALGGNVPIVQLSGSTIYDLPPRGGAVADYLPLGYEAAASARLTPVAGGRVGAGAGATVGKYRGRRLAMPGGLGSAAEKLRGLGWVGALAVVNSVGAVRDPETGRWIAGARSGSGRIQPPINTWRVGAGARNGSTGTTLVLVATEVPLDRRELQRVAVMAQTGVARAITPAHAAVDGDIVFAVSTRMRSGKLPDRASIQATDLVGHAASNLVERSIVRAMHR